MADRKTVKRRGLRDAWRLIDPRDILYHLGNLLTKRSLRYTMLTAGLSLLVYLGEAVGLPNLPNISVRQAIALPLMVGGVALVGGMLLKIIPSLLAGRLVVVAQASDINLMEDYRKSRSEGHIEQIWRRVYQYETDLPPAAQALLGGTGPTREGFARLIRVALERHIPQTRQKFEVGIDIAFYEDWLDGAYFDQTDVKLSEQYHGDVALAGIRRVVDCPVGLALGHLPLKLSRRFWFALTTRAFAVSIGAAVTRLNRRYETDLFNAQVLLWPGEEDQGWLEPFPGSREEVLVRRQRLLDRVFGPDLRNLRIMIDRLMFCDFRLAGELRGLFDPEYVDSALDQDLLTDLAAVGHSKAFVERMRQLVGAAREDLKVFDEHLLKHRGDLLSADSDRGLRAARIGFHVDAGGLKRKVLRAAARKRISDRALARIDALIDRAAEQRQTYTRWLVALRLHHTLAWIAVHEYTELIEALYAPCREID